MKNIKKMVVLSLLSSFIVAFCVEKPIVVIIPSYNNERWVEQNVSSVLTQKYTNFRVVYVDDCSSDKTYELVQAIVERFGQQDKVTLIHNSERYGAMANWYTTIHTCHDNEIVVALDGDDWLPHDLVLAYLNKVYSEQDIWMSYGQFIEYPSGIIHREYSKPFSSEVIQANTFRKVEQLPMSHLRTFYAWLFKAIKLEDFLYQEKFYQMTCDKVMLASLIEMAGHRHLCCSDVLYVYNNSNEISDHRVDANLQHSLAWYILSLAPCQRLEAPVSYELDETDTVSALILNKDIKESFDFKNSLIATCAALKSDYVLLCKDFPGTDVSKNIKAYMGLLKKTQVPIFYTHLKASSAGKQLFAKQLPCVNHELNAFAWFAKNKTESLIFSILDLTLWKKDLLQKALEAIVFSDIKELDEQLHNFVEHNNLLGLLSLT